MLAAKFFGKRRSGGWKIPRDVEFFASVTCLAVWRLCTGATAWAVGRLIHDAGDDRVTFDPTAHRVAISGTWPLKLEWRRIRPTANGFLAVYTEMVGEITLAEIKRGVHAIYVGTQLDSFVRADVPPRLLSPTVSSGAVRLHVQGPIELGRPLLADRELRAEIQAAQVLLQGNCDWGNMPKLEYGRRLAFDDMDRGTDGVPFAVRHAVPGEVMLVEERGFGMFLPGAMAPTATSEVAELL